MEVLLGTIFVLSLYLTSAGQYIKSQHSPTALIKPTSMSCPCATSSPITETCPVFSSCHAKARTHMFSCCLDRAGRCTWPTQEMPLEHLALVAKELSFLGPTGLNIQRNSSWQATTPRALPRQQTETYPSLPETKTYWLVLELQSEGFTTHLEATEMLSGNVGQGMSFLHNLSASTAHHRFSEQLIHLYGALIFALTHRICPRSPSLEASRIYNCCSTGLYIFTYFKSCCLRVWFPITLKWGNEVLPEIPPLETLTGLGIPSTTGAIKNKSGCLDNHKGWETTKN